MFKLENKSPGIRAIPSASGRHIMLDPGQSRTTADITPGQAKFIKRGMDKGDKLEITATSPAGQEILDRAYKGDDPAAASKKERVRVSVDRDMIAEANAKKAEVDVDEDDFAGDGDDNEDEDTSSQRPSDPNLEKSQALLKEADDLEFKELNARLKKLMASDYPKEGIKSRKAAKVALREFIKSRS